MSANTFIRSFAGGEIAPELFGRIDLDKYQSGLKLCENFEVLPHGPVANRAGFKYVLEVKDNTKAVRLIPFSFSVDQTMVLEFGDQYIRFHTLGATLLETAKNITGITQANPGVVTSAAHGFSNDQWIYIASVGGMTTLNGRFFKVANVTANTFTLKDLAGTAINTTTLSAYTSGGTAARVYEISTPYLEADLFDLHYVQSADVLSITHPTYAPRELRRLSAVSWQLSAISFASTLTAPVQPSVITQPGGPIVPGTDIFHRYLITAVNSKEEESPASVPAVGTETRTITAITNANPAIFTVSDWCYSAGGFWLQISGVGGMTQVNGKTYRVQDYSGVGPFNISVRDSDGVLLDSTAFGVYTAGGVATLQGVYSDLTTAGTYNEIRWTVDTTVERYNVYKEQNGVFGYIGQSTTGIFKDDNIIPDFSKSPPVSSTAFTAANDYPSAVSYYEQRRVFAATNNAPHSLLFSRPGTESNLSSSLPVQDDDAITFTINARQQNRIRHLVPLGDLIALTASGAWKIFASGGEAFTPTTATARPAAYVGANNVQPAVTESALLYVQAQGSKLRELFYSWESQNYRADDVSILIPHLIKNFTMIDMAYSSAPNPTAWVVRSDGVLLGLTYLPEQRIRAWHQHYTDGGDFKSACCVTESNEDALYAVVQRTVNGRTVKYIERKASRDFDELEDAFFVDCGLTYSGSAATTITGLHHLEGEEVSILADGAVQPGTTVTNGAVTLQQAASKVHIGIPITASVETLPAVFSDAGAFGISMLKNINKVFLRVERSSGIFVGPSADELTEAKQRTTEPWGSPPALVSEIVEVPIEGDWNYEGSIYVRQTQPLPLMLVHAVLEVAPGG